MRSVKVLITLALTLASATLVLGWDYYPLGGGNAEKIIVVDYPNEPYNCKGAWFFEKDGGACWMPWSTATPPIRGEWQNFDANYAWHMGGDVKELSSPTTNLYALDATIKGTHVYSFAGGNDWVSAESDINNGYLMYHDGQFVEAPTGENDKGCYMVALCVIGKLDKYRSID